MLKQARFALILALLSIGGVLSGCDKVVDYVNQNCSAGEGSLSCGGDNGNNNG